MYIKNQVIETWEKLIYWQYFTSKYKHGAMERRIIRNQQVGLLDLFKKL